MQCEDYPCCSHPQGQCEDKAEYTSDYWYEVMARREAAGFDFDDPMFDEY
jgi:hypothetical protein